MAEMEIRKVQRSGGSSFIVSLPKKWVDATNIQKNDPVGLIIQSDGTLLVTPNTTGVQLQRKKVFMADAGTDHTLLLRELVGAYITGYTEIVIRSKHRLPADIIEQVRNFTAMSIGQEIVEETDTEIRVKDLLNPAEMPIENTLRRMAIIVNKMSEDAITALRDQNRSLAISVIERDNDVDRLQWLIARQVNLIFSDVNLSRRMDIPVATASGYIQIAKIIERIADHATKIAKNAVELTDIAIENGIYEGIQRAERDAMAIFRAAMEAFHSGDLEKANATIGQTTPLEKRCREVSRMALSFDAANAIHFVYIADSLRRIGDYSTDICEHTINHIVGINA
ncbi:phosphate uptake regulator PhoU [Methanogenium organophilum]|uniref:Phosphate uptake regulator PhoU n=1 Tax=Methanogenium organophilum TaxID=2199 RepID=A0A9X9S1L2_METOG|nr:phosphate uptake regulator PhoU [Methanogenium organophilum]WAI00183.1 phosphate uptake regulator PhoU [Methanogenium organophilum]